MKLWIGLTGWGDHDHLYPPGTATKDKLKEYSSHFPVVEVDASFYAIQPSKNYRKWLGETPDSFYFVVKAYQGMTKHMREELPFSSHEEMFSQFIKSIQPLLETGRLKAVLFQFPPWFDCKKENVSYLRWVKEQMEKIPCALEFRHQSWFSAALKEKTIQFMQNEGWIHTICDEPQAGEGSVPIILAATHPKLAMIRMHGRNQYGWTSRKENWREVRYLYRYNREELLGWKKRIEQLAQTTDEIILLFNNNSGGDAAQNAKELMDLLGLDYTGLSPRQMGLFD